MNILFLVLWPSRVNTCKRRPIFMIFVFNETVKNYFLKLMVHYSMKFVLVEYGGKFSCKKIILEQLGKKLNCGVPHNSMLAHLKSKSQNYIVR